MISWLQALDCALFRLINRSLANPMFDWLMPQLAGNRLFLPLVVVLGVMLLWKGGQRARLFVVCMALAIALTDGLVGNTIKKAVARPRPGLALADTRCLMPSTTSGSMPSNHAANWFAATMVAFIFYRRSWRFLVPFAATVSLSRVYNGVHYPSDVIAGAILGAGTAAATVWLADALWGRVGRKWFPIWWELLPSVIAIATREESKVQSPKSKVQTGAPEVEVRGANKQSRDREGAPTENLTSSGPQSEIRNPKSAIDSHWLRLGYILIAALLLFRLCYIAFGTIELTHDEAYQWLWSKHLALSYYSKPPGIALVQFAGTHLWGDTQFGVRFFSPIFAAILSLVMLRFMAREVGARQGFILLLVVAAVPLLNIGTILMTIDPPLVLCWTLAMMAGWRALQSDGATKHWLLMGIAAGLGFLSKYTALYLIPCFALYFLLWKPARVHLRKPGPWLALLVIGISTLPVLLWNSEHGWITVHHVRDNAAISNKWTPTLRYFWEFLGIETALLNPIFFLAALWAMVAFWKSRAGVSPAPELPPPGPRGRREACATFALCLFFFCLSAPVFLGHLLYTLHSRVQPNWIAPAVVPMFCLMVVYWDALARGQRPEVRGQFRSVVSGHLLAVGLLLGLGASVLLHEPKLIGKIAGHPLPGEMDPLRRALAWKESSAVVDEARQKLLREGKPVFIIADHYGMAGEFSFYIPEARSAISLPSIALAKEGGQWSVVSGQSARPLVYCVTPTQPNNQLYFWPEYRYRGSRPGENAIYVAELGPFPLERGWFRKWLRGKEIGYASPPETTAPPPLLLREFESVTDLGMKEVKLGGRIFRRLQLFECRNLR